MLIRGTTEYQVISLLASEGGLWVGLFPEPKPEPPSNHRTVLTPLSTLDCRHTWRINIGRLIKLVFFFFS